jgi:Snf7
MVNVAGDVDVEAPCFRLTSYVWVFFARAVTSQKQHGVAMLVEQLRSLRVDLKLQLSKSLTDITENKKTVCSLRAKGSGKRDLIIVVLIKKSLTMKKTRDGLVGRINTIEMQIEALESSDFNRTMLKTMQSTADVMRKMGLEKGLSQADTAISELEDNMQLAGEMNNALSYTNVDYLNDDELDAELDELMDIPSTKTTDVPVTLPTSAAPTVSEPVPEKVITESVEMVSSIPEKVITRSVEMVSSMRQSDNVDAVAI